MSTPSKVRWIQLRRVSCKCGEDYVLFLTGIAHGLTHMSFYQRHQPLVLEAAQERIRNKLRQLEGGPRLGRGQCPSCGELQPWAPTRSLLVRTAVGGVLGGLLAATCVLAFRIVRITISPLQATLVVIGSASAGVLAGVVNEVFLPTTDRLPPEATLPYATFESLLAQSREQGRPVENLWAERLGIDAQEASLLSQRLASGGGFE